MGLCQYVDLCFHALSLPCLHTFWHAIPTSFFKVFMWKGLATNLTPCTLLCSPSHKVGCLVNTHLSIPSPVGNWRSSHRLADQLVRTGSQSTCPTHRHRYSKCKSLQNKQWPARLYHNVHDFGYRQSVSRVHLATLTHVTIHQLPSKLWAM